MQIEFVNLPINITSVSLNGDTTGFSSIDILSATRTANIADMRFTTDDIAHLTYAAIIEAINNRFSGIAYSGQITHASGITVYIQSKNYYAQALQSLANAYICNEHLLSDVLAGNTSLPDSIAEHNDINPLSVDGMHEIANRGEYISCIQPDGGSFTEQTHDDLYSALAEIQADSDLRAYVYTAGYNIAGNLTFITFNKP